MAGFKVKYTLAAKLVNELAEAADEKVLARPSPATARVDLLCLDELGYMELDRHCAAIVDRAGEVGALEDVLCGQAKPWAMAVCAT
ncbi:ATP-binding protein [Nonomuraea indica]|uniref:ATP-binding protein n=1 Tax=Nonomuraea indica TaxID=1581193 RepID=A0ABW7ZXW5_9ACTN